MRGKSARDLSAGVDSDSAAVPVDAKLLGQVRLARTVGSHTLLKQRLKQNVVLAQHGVPLEFCPLVIVGIATCLRVRPGDICLAQ